MSNPPPYVHVQAPPQSIIIIPRQDPNRSRNICARCCIGCGTVCLAPFQLVRFCFGLWPKMERINRLVLSFFTFAAIALTAGLVLAYVTYGENDLAASPADMRPLDEKFSSSFCSHFEVTKASAPVEVYFFDKMPPIRKDFRKNYVIEVDPQNIDTKHWEKVNFYMLKGSRLTVQAQATMTFPPVGVFLIKGRYNLGEWIGDQDCCYLKKDTASSFSWSYFAYNITETDEYFVTMSMSDYGFSSGGSATVRAKFGLQKTMYDWREATSVCHNYTDSGCGEDLRYGSDQVAIMYATGRDQSGSLVKEYNIGTMCKPRLLLYVPSFLGAPVVAYALWALMLWFCFPDKTPRRNAQAWSPHAVNSGDQADLVTNQVL